jgi:hypothetical protein
VRLAGREADGVRQRANPDGGAPFYDVTFLRTPGLGIDTYAGDPYAVPFEVLTDVERSVSLTVDARATSGNASHLEQGVLLSRVLWDRAVPGRIAISAADPVATAAGVQVPLATKDAVPGPKRARPHRHQHLREQCALRAELQRSDRRMWHQPRLHRALRGTHPGSP